jgi:hypothetical protein
MELASSYTEDELAVLADFFARMASVWKTERDLLKLMGRNKSGRRQLR